MKRCTSDEIADALRGEIECGRWKAGEALPSCNDLCSRFCAGEWAVRHALRSLRDRGYVSICQNRGVTVSQKMLRAWKGRIAFVTLDETASYFPAACGRVFRAASVKTDGIAPPCSRLSSEKANTTFHALNG